MAKAIRNSGASVRARLLKLSKANGQSFDLELTRFALDLRKAYGIGAIARQAWMGGQKPFLLTTVMSRNVLSGR